tara:strand:- start:8549 stop:9439 length:891 start_codon:yes stop_codon:yes gene_type:complete
LPKIHRYNVENFKEEIDVDFEHSDYFWKEFNEHTDYPTEPYRTETYGVAYVKTGQLFLTTGLTDHDIKAPALLSIGPNVIRKWTQTYKSASTETIFFTKEFLVTKAVDSGKLNNIPYYEHPDLHVFKLNTKDEECITTLFDTLKNFIESKYVNRDRFVREQIALLNIMLDELHNRNEVSITKSKNNLLSKFKDLASNHIKEYKDVAWYAEKLNIPAKRLSEKVKIELGKTASRFLHDLLIIEAKILLQNPDATVSEIAYALNFSDPSTFGKYFKKYSGYTPKKYRDNIQVNTISKI